MVPQRIQLSRAKGWRKPEGAVVVSRPSRWGNPFIVGMHGDRQQCVASYRDLVGGLISTVGASPGYADQQNAFMQFRDHLWELRGKDLCCWCRAGMPCHADVLIEIANA